jgi:hypothetical protein
MVNLTLSASGHVHFLPRSRFMRAFPGLLVSMLLTMPAPSYGQNCADLFAALAGRPLPKVIDLTKLTKTQEVADQLAQIRASDIVVLSPAMLSNKDLEGPLQASRVKLVLSSDVPVERVKTQLDHRIAGAKIIANLPLSEAGLKEVFADVPDVPSRLPQVSAYLGTVRKTLEETKACRFLESANGSESLASQLKKQIEQTPKGETIILLTHNDAAGRIRFADGSSESLIEINKLLEATNVFGIVLTCSSARLAARDGKAVYTTSDIEFDHAAKALRQVYQSQLLEDHCTTTANLVTRLNEAFDAQRQQSEKVIRLIATGIGGSLVAIVLDDLGEKRCRCEDGTYSAECCKPADGETPKP